jgi:flagellar assembly protein FliH
MSSKVLLPCDQKTVNPVAWRHIDSLRQTEDAGKDAAKKDPDPDLEARIAQLEAQYQQKVREAHAAGLREGETAGRSRAAAELQPVVERLTRSIQEIANLRGRLRREAEADVVQLALAVARRVVRRELAMDCDALRGLVLAALEKLQGQEISRVKVHPSHAAMVTSCLQQLSTAGHVEVLPDPSREPGSVIFETTRGNLDVSVDSQLQEIERGLADRLRKQS